MRRADIEVPNLPVDVNSWGRSACYPRGNFYPLSDGPSTRDRRITMPYFRTCSSCSSRSQASLCHCTLKMISDHLEETFGRLRYLLGGDRPSQTTHQTLSSNQLMVQSEDFNIQRVVSQRRLHSYLRPCFIVSHLSCTLYIKTQYQAVVKLHGVFSSCRG
jgi:hypothetical protein